MCVKCGINSCGCGGKSCDVLSGTKIITGHNIVLGDISRYISKWLVRYNYRLSCEWLLRL
jgi:hypothetical protein